jgi:hypothetical protein
MYVTVLNAYSNQDILQGISTSTLVCLRLKKRDEANESQKVSIPNFMI